MLQSIDHLFTLLPTGDNGKADSGMLGMLMPVLKQGLVLLGRRVDKLPSEQLALGEQVFAAALSTLANGLGDPEIDATAYQQQLTANMATVIDRAKTPTVV